MKKEDIIHMIKQKTNDLQPSEHISPAAMKDLLNQNFPNGNQLDNEQTNHSSIHKRHMHQAVAAASLLLCLSGGYALHHLSSNNISQPEFLTECATEITSEEIKEVSSEITRNTVLSTPDSYEDYFDAMQKSYNDYYDQLATVATYVDEAEEVVEEADISADSVAESALSTNNFSNDATKGNSSSQTDFSTTNTQEKNVDEGDVIKTDGTYIYKLLTGFNQNTGNTTYQLNITKTDNGELTSVSTIDLTDALPLETEDDYIDFYEFYIYHNKLIGIYTHERYTNDEFANTTNILIYDIADKENPKPLKTLTQSGYYGSSRISDGYLYTTSNYSQSLSDRTKYKDYIPCLNDDTISATNIFYPDNVILDSTNVITSLDLEQPSDFTDSKAISCAGSQIYVSDSSIYCYSTLYTGKTQTQIMKVSYNKGKLSVGNSAVVTGYLYGSFALNEYDQHLRVVATIPANNISLLRSTDIIETTDIATESQEDINALYILDENMELTGKIAGIAPGEQIYSARFFGDIGYLVTYRNTDPLFSVDLSDPANPTILGELKVTGFSNYLHFYQDNILLGLGEETDPETGETLGLKLSMFDIHDPENVTEQNKYILEDADYSEALYNHKAIMIDPEKNIFGFMYYNDDDFRTVYYSTYTYDEKDGFIETARYEISDDSALDTDSIRGLYIGNYFYLTTNKTITSYPIGSTTKLSQIKF